MKYNVQYSRPDDSSKAVSDWRERTTIIEANSPKEARVKANKKLDYLGTWMILDIYPVNDEVRPDVSSDDNEFDKRIADKTKTPLHHNFISFIRYTASFNNKPVDEVWRLWKEYTAKCDSYDQSPTKAEFCQWYKLECSENILQLI
jgi:hypothetical protein